MDKHLADVRRYDALADAELVERIVKHLGVALHNPASATVDCGKDDEIERVIENWCRNKLDVADEKRSATAVRLVAETMARDGEADRVTFYYLCAKHLGRLEAV
jgi:predicted neutral ceramidase superfamily lipid hydrolase